MNQKKSYQNELQEIISFLSQRNFFGDPYLAKEGFRRSIELLAGHTLSKDADFPPDVIHRDFKLEFNDLGFSCRLGLRFDFSINLHEEKIKLHSIRTKLEGIAMDYDRNKVAVPTLKEIEDLLHQEHKKRTRGFRGPGR